METTTHLDITDAGFEAFLQSREEPDWLLQLRRDAWRTFQQLDWPSRRQEEWMRTDIRLLKIDRYSLPGELRADVQLPPARLRQPMQLAGAAASLDSHPVESQLEPRWAERGVLFGSLQRLVVEHSQLLRPYLERPTIDPATDKFAALSAACWSGGTLLYVPQAVAVDQPLHVLSAMRDGGTDFGRTLVVLEEGAEATLVAETASAGEGDGLHCGMIELLVHPGARLRYINLQNWSPAVWHFAHQKAVVDRRASLQWTIGALGSRLAKVNQHVVMAGPEADVQVNGVMFTEGKQHLSYHTLQHHQAEACKSDLLYKAALQDRSRTVWRGMIKVDRQAQRTDGYQRNDNLLLSPGVRADSIPGLEIEADDVRCTHGSTTGRVDEELIFYCQCRGLTRREATRTIVTGFFQQVFDRITVESARESLAQAIARRVREYS